MKQTLFCLLLCAGILPLNKPLTSSAGPLATKVPATGLQLFSQPSPENEKMRAVVFRAQDMCRAELKDFEFDIHYKVVSATVYFSGTNFRNTETGFINSNSLQPIRKLMDRCAGGTLVVFDNVKVMGPDNLLRTIPGTSYMLQ